MARIRVDTPTNSLAGCDRKSFVPRDRSSSHEAIARNGFAIYRDEREYSSDRGSFRIALLPSRLDVDYGGISSIEMAASLVGEYEKSGVFLSESFDRILKLQATEDDLDRFIKILRAARKAVAERG